MNKLLSTIGHYLTCNTHQLELDLYFSVRSQADCHTLRADGIPWLTWSLSEWSDWLVCYIISKNGHHQFLPSMYAHASPPLRDGVYFLSLWIWAGLMTVLTNRMQQKWHSELLHPGLKNGSFLFHPCYEKPRLHWEGTQKRPKRLQSTVSAQLPEKSQHQLPAKWVSHLGSSNPTGPQNGCGPS